MLALSKQIFNCAHIFYGHPVQNLITKASIYDFKNIIFNSARIIDNIFKNVHIFADYPVHHEEQGDGDWVEGVGRRQQGQDQVLNTLLKKFENKLQNTHC